MTLWLIHGFTGDPASWDEVVAALPAGTPVRRVTLLGHAREPAAPLAWTAEVDRIATLIARTPGPAHLAGYSLGARVALGVLARHPTLVAGATLISGHPGLSDGERPGRRSIDAMWIELLETRGIAAFEAAWAAQPLFASQARLAAADRRRVQARRLAHDPHGLSQSLRCLGLAEMPPLAAPTVPTQVLCGALDDKFCALAPRFGHPVTVVAGAGHDLPLEAPAQVATALQKGLS